MMITQDSTPEEIDAWPSLSRNEGGPTVAEPMPRIVSVACLDCLGGRRRDPRRRCAKCNGLRLIWVPLGLPKSPKYEPAPWGDSHANSVYGVK